MTTMTAPRTDPALEADGWLETGYVNHRSGELRERYTGEVERFWDDDLNDWELEPVVEYRCPEHGEGVDIVDGGFHDDMGGTSTEWVELVCGCTFACTDLSAIF